jgi:hypothetical protein
MKGLLLLGTPAAPISVTLPERQPRRRKKREKLLIATAIVFDRDAVIEHNRIGSFSRLEVGGFTAHLSRGCRVGTATPDRLDAR